MENSTGGTDFLLNSVQGEWEEFILPKIQKLDRKVAIKFLNEKYSQDAEKLKRAIIAALVLVRGLCGI